MQSKIFDCKIFEFFKNFAILKFLKNFKIGAAGTFFENSKKREKIVIFDFSLKKSKIAS